MTPIGREPMPSGNCSALHLDLLAQTLFVRAIDLKKQSHSDQAEACSFRLKLNAILVHLVRCCLLSIDASAQLHHARESPLALMARSAVPHFCRVRLRLPTLAAHARTAETSPRRLMHDSAFSAVLRPCRCSRALKAHQLHPAARQQPVSRLTAFASTRRARLLRLAASAHRSTLDRLSLRSACFAASVITCCDLLADHA